MKNNLKKIIKHEQLETIKEENDMKNFVIKYNIYRFVIAYTIGIALESFILSFVQDIIMPLLKPIMSQILEIGVNIGPFFFKLDNVIKNLINLIIISFMVFKLHNILINKKIL